MGVIRDYRHPFTFGLTGCALSRTGRIYGSTSSSSCSASSSCCRASSTCCHAFLHTAAPRLRAAAHCLRVATHLYIRPHIVLELPRRASSTCCHASLPTVAPLKDHTGRYCTLVTRGKYYISYSRSANSGSYKIGFRTELIVVA